MSILMLGYIREGSDHMYGIAMMKRKFEATHVPRRKINLSEDDMRQLNVKQLSKKHDFSTMSIRRYIHRKGLTPKPERTLSFNLDFFRTMTPDMAYVLGWIASDGCISENRVVISLQVSDKPILESLKGVIGYTGTIKETSQHDTRTLKTYHHAVLTICSKELIEILATYGLGPRKSLTLEYPDLPGEMQASFVRGFFDGDGCISKMSGARTNYRISFSGPRPFLESLRAVINAQNELTSGSICSKKKIADLAYTGRHSAECILQWMYKTSRPETRLQRKYEKYVLAMADGARRDSTPRTRTFESMRATMIKKGNTGSFNISKKAIKKYALKFDEVARLWS